MDSAQIYKDLYSTSYNFTNKLSYAKNLNVMKNLKFENFLPKQKDNTNCKRVFQMSVKQHASLKSKGKMRWSGR